jgi:hypothetical protein
MLFFTNYSEKSSKSLVNKGKGCTIYHVPCTNNVKMFKLTAFIVNRLLVRLLLSDCGLQTADCRQLLIPYS